jgi:hypothetical protein
VPGSSDGGDDAVFAPRSVRGTGGRPPILVAGLLVALAGLVALGLYRPADDLARDGVAIAPDTAPTLRAEPVMSPRLREPLTEPSSGASALIKLEVRPDGGHLFVHGEVFSNRIRVVVVSLRDAGGGAADIRTVTMPGGSTAFRIGSVDRFDVLFDRSESMTEGFTVQASGYDADDDRIESVTASAEPAQS